VRIVRQRVQEVKSIEEVLSLDAKVEKEKISLRNLSVKPNLRKEIIDLQMSSQEFRDFKGKEMKRDNHEFCVDSDGVMYFRDRLCVPNDVELEKKILSRYTIHPGKIKMYQDLKEVGMKRDVVQYISMCLTCQKVKREQKKSASLLQPLLIPQWKWKCVTMDFVCSLLMSKIRKMLFQ
jgi:hypothetical protein